MNSVKTCGLRSGCLSAWVLSLTLFLLVASCAPSPEVEKEPPLALGSCPPYIGTLERWVLTGPPMGTLGEVIRLNPEGTTVQASLPEIGDVPNRIRACGKFAFVVNSLSHNLKIIDSERFAVTGTIALPEGSNPMDVTFASGRGFVSSLFHNVLYSFSISNGALGVSLPTGISPTPVHAYGDKIFVGNTGFVSFGSPYSPASISVYSAKDLTLITTISLPCLNPQALVGEGKEIYALCTGDYTTPAHLLRLDGDRYAIEVSASLPPAPGTLVLGKNRIYAGGWSYGVKVLKRSELTPQGEALAGMSPNWGFEDPEREELWIGLSVEKKVVVLSAKDLSQVREIPIGAPVQDLLLLKGGG